MRNRVRVQKKNPSASADASGHPDYSLDANWTDIGTFYCNIMTRGGRERWRFNQIEAEVDRILEFRSSKTTRAFGPENRILFTEDGSTKKWDIGAAFDVDGARQIVEVHTTEVK